MNFLREIVTKLVNWWVRPRNLRFTICKYFFTSSLLVLTAKGIFFGLSYDDVKIELNISSLTSSAALDYLLFFLLCISIIGFLIEWYVDFRALSRKRAVLISHQGMDACITNPLQNVVRLKYPNITPVKIDLRQFMSGRSVNEPLKAAEETRRKVVNAKEIIGDDNVADIFYIYGGLAPVPLAFLAGHTFSNKNDIEVWDYDRDQTGTACWYSLNYNSYIDTPDFIYDASSLSSEVCLIMSLSFPIDEADLEVKFYGKPIISITPQKYGNDNFGSITLQQKMQKKFRDLLIELNRLGVLKIHIFCAAQNSLCFNLGRQIDDNHPQCIVYQYEKNSPEKYPWGIKLNGLKHGETIIA